MISADKPLRPDGMAGFRRNCVRRLPRRERACRRREDNGLVARPNSRTAICGASQRKHDTGHYEAGFWGAQRRRGALEWRRTRHAGREGCGACSVAARAPAYPPHREAAPHRERGEATRTWRLDIRIAKHRAPCRAREWLLSSRRETKPATRSIRYEPGVARFAGRGVAEGMRSGRRAASRESVLAGVTDQVGVRFKVQLAHGRALLRGDGRYRSVQPLRDFGHAQAERE